MATPRVTVIYSPHPDDETLRLSGYISQAAARGDRLILVAVTNGESTSLVSTWNSTPEAISTARILEQHRAWSHLSGGQVEVIRLNIPDGSVAAHMATITAKASALEAQYKGNIEHYVAARDTDEHEDHRSVVQAVRAAAPAVARFSTPPGTVGGTKYLPSNVPSATEAYESYRALGWYSVPTLFNNLKAQGFCSYIVW